MKTPEEVMMGLCQGWHGKSSGLPQKDAQFRNMEWSLENGR